MIRTRIAPSPTGEDLHIGNVYTALLNYAFAKKNKGKFIVRIEDTDRLRLIKGSEKRILSSLKWFGLNYDEGPDREGPYAPYRQSDRKETYKKYAEELIEKGHAYYCFCTPTRLEEMRNKQKENKQPVLYDGHCRKYLVAEARDKAVNESYVVRMKIPETGSTEFADLLRGEITFENKLLDDQVILKSDGYPTYHLGVVVDDHVMNITHVIRADEWISSTAKHILLYQFFGWELPVFAHTPILRNPDRSKLSKRKNPVWVSWYRNEGFLPEAILNYLALLGWSHPDEKEVFSLLEFIEVFDLKDIKPIGPVFDLVKLRWLNGIYIRNLESKALSEKLREFNSKYMDFDNKVFEKIVKIAQTRMETLKDYEALTKHFFDDFKPTIETAEDKEVMGSLYVSLNSIEKWDKDEIFPVLKSILVNHKIKMPVLYRLLTGTTSGLPLPESLEILGKERTLQRLVLSI